LLLFTRIFYYGVEVYANTHSSYLEKLMVLNNKILRIVQFKPLKTHVLNLYKNYQNTSVSATVFDT